MSEIMQTITSAIWMVLAVIVFVKVRYWSKTFSELYEELKNSIRSDDNAE